MSSLLYVTVIRHRHSSSSPHPCVAKVISPSGCLVTNGELSKMSVSCQGQVSGAGGRTELLEGNVINHWSDLLGAVWLSR
ncbi:hypothetical protein E2C01_053651 [Portunus trituberculatus]|uniref:Uncharacterized protein n=1 Tax=Portunus trituberculatus TaxID=210409 RepID=A0A5B7GR25_PORTR|nr:hypothetical protein [Portunus trituberculatus]